MKRAFITGVTGQDGSYLAELLLSEGYVVGCLVRRKVTDGLGNAAGIASRVKFYPGDLADLPSIMAALEDFMPSEVYNLAAQSCVAYSFKAPAATMAATGLGVANMLEAVRLCAPLAKFYQASSSEMFGNEPAPQNEDTEFRPRSPYACAKVYAHNMVRTYRESYGLWACCGILFNHESPRRGLEFVTRKIARAVARIKTGKQAGPIPLGNVDAKRDWGYAGDYVKAMFAMLQYERPEDFVIGTGVSATVGQWVELCVKAAGLPGEWQEYVGYDAAMIRPAEVNYLKADATKAARRLGWRPSVTLPALAEMMVNAELEQCQSLKS